MSKKKVFVVIPTIRSLKFLEKWNGEFKHTYGLIIEDHKLKEIETPTKFFKKVYHYSHEDIEKEMKGNSWIFSRKNAGIRTYGFYKAYQLGADVIITLDDDCYPVESNFIKQHLDNLSFKTAENWFATYPDPKYMYTRGFPYGVRNKLRVNLSHGLWSGALDLDAKVEVKLPKLLNEDAYPPIRQIVPRGYFFPMCSMNLAFTREAVPLLFFPMMGKDVKGADWEYDRYDDIWSGIFLKKIFDHLGWSVINGSPYVEHRKASLPHHNLTKELKGMGVNELLWKKVDQIELTQKTPIKCYKELARKMVFPKGGYFEKLRQAMILWAGLFE